MRRVLGFSALLLLLSAGVVLRADKAVNVYDIPRWVMAGGGGNSGANPYALTGTVGQGVVGTANNNPYHLCSGFWCRPDRYRYAVYLPQVMRQFP